jgi:hypothetical protein
MQTEDAKEGIAAWMEKRQPVWRGKQGRRILNAICTRDLGR